MKSGQVLAEESSLQRHLVLCGVTVLPQLCRNSPFPIARGRASTQQRAAWALQPWVHSRECVSVVWDCQFSRGTLGGKKQSPWLIQQLSFICSRKTLQFQQVLLLSILSLSRCLCLPDFLCGLYHLPCVFLATQYCAWLCQCQSAGICGMNSSSMTKYLGGGIVSSS